MTDERESFLLPDWGWVANPETALCGCLTFVRDRSVEQLMRAFGMDPGAARMLPRRQAGEAVRFPLRDNQRDVVNAVIRAGTTGDWAYAFEDPWFEAMSADGFVEGVASRLSVGTEAVVVAWTPTGDRVQFMADRNIVTSFEPLIAFDRAGDEPDRFLDAMRQVGLPVDNPDNQSSGEGPAEAPNPLIAALDMLTMVLGIELDEDTIEGPLLTVQRAPGATVPRG